MNENVLRGGKRYVNNVKVAHPLKPLVSIITVVYNGEQYLEQTILSVLNQTYLNIEYIIVDGGSKDRTVDIIKRYEDQIDYWVSEPDKGIYDAMNKGISLATGELIGIINSDDWYESYCVEEIVELFRQHQESIIYGLMRHIKNELPIETYAPYPNSIPFKMLPHPTCFVPHSIYKKYGVFDVTYRSCADYHLILRLHRKNVSFILLEKVLANFRMGGFSFKFKSLRESFNMRYEMGYISNFQRITRISVLYILNLLKK